MVKPLQYFLPFIWYGRPVPFFFFKIAGLLECSADIFERLCERFEEKATRSSFCKLVRHFLVKMRLRRALLVRRYGCFCQLKVWPFSKTGRLFVYKRYYRVKSKSKAVLRVNYGDGGTVVL